MSHILVLADDDGGSVFMITQDSPEKPTPIIWCEAGGVNVDELRAYQLNVGDLNPLIVLVLKVEQIQLVPVDWAAITNQIREAVNAYFQSPLLEQINYSVKNLFAPTIRQYANNFAKLDNAFNAVKKYERVDQPISGALSFSCLFNPKAFKDFVVDALGDAAKELDAPKSELNVTAVLKSTLQQQEGGMLRVGESDFDVIETFIATLFPH